MDSKTLISYSLLLCAIGNIGVRSNGEASLRSSHPTLPTIFSTQILDDENSETKHANRYKRVPNDLHVRSNEREDDVDGAPPDHAVPYSYHENPDEPPTKPRYTKPGDWAKPSPESDIPLDFVPTKLYAQVRKTHTVKRLPREEALKSAETAEEILAAPRLREVVSKSKSNTVYTEEGYEDAAYDHAGHVREADFNEGYASKLDDERGTKKGEKTGARRSDEEETNVEESDSADELNDYEDEYRNHAEESSRVEKTSPEKRSESEYERLKSQLKNSGIDPRQVAENGIEKLEEDLNREYEEAAKNTEKEVPENLKNSENDAEEAEEEGDDDDEKTRSVDDAKNSEEHGRRLGKKIDEPEASSRAISVTASGEAFESQNNEIRRVSSSPEDDKPPLQSSMGFAESDGSERRADEFETTPDYGKLFWDYYKTDANIWKSHVTSAPNAVTSATNEDKSVSGSLTSVPRFPSIETEIAAYDTFAFTPPSAEFSGSALAPSSDTDFQYPSATSFYESWKRQDRSPDSQEIIDHESLESSSSANPIGSGETSKTGSDLGLNLQNGESATTLAGPKKLSYTVIIRPGDKSTTRTPPCDKENNFRPAESNFGDERTNPGYASATNQFDGKFEPVAMNGFDAPGQDLTVIRPPLPVPLGQIAFADFPSDPHGSLVHPSVTQESGHWQLGQEINGDRDVYRVSENPDNYRLHNHIGHASKAPRVRHHRGPPPGRKRNHYYPLFTKLVPPSPASRSKYAEYSGVRRNLKPKSRNDRSSRGGVWPELLKFYRLMDGSIFGRRRRRSVEENITKGAVSRSREKVGDNVAALSGENHLWHERNLFHEGTNRLVAASAGGADPPNDDNRRREKSSRTESRKRRGGEDLFDETPRIAEEVINAEIESRFEDKDDHEESSNADDDSSESERAKIEVEVPVFNFTEVIDSNERHRAIKTRPRQAETLNLEKYPFYANSEVSRSSALKYITNPRQVPRKTLGGTEFYDSRDRYLECAEVEPNLEKVIPEEAEPDADREPRGDQIRLRGLGDKLDCFRAKYFDKNPLDNPLFMEKNVGEPRVPEELDPAKFASRISGIASNEAEERVARRMSRKPEVHDLRRSGSRINQVTGEAAKNDRQRVNDDGSSKPGSRYPKVGERYRERTRGRRPTQTTTESPETPVTPYQREVYEDVMGTIKNLAGMYQTFGESVQSPSIQPNVNHLSVVPKENDWGFPVVHITQKPRGFMIRGMLPPQPSEPQTHHRYRIIPYRTNKVSYGTRPRTKPPPGAEGAKVGYFKTVRVHKRSLDDDRVLDSYAEESRNVPVNSTRDTNEAAGSEKITYTIKDRIRHSRPRGEFGRNGKFTNLEAAGTEDVRRREPRYERVRRKKVPSSTNEPAATSSRQEVDAANSEKTTVSSLKKPSVAQRTPREDFLDEPGEMYKIQYSTPQRREARPSDARRRTQERLGSKDSEEKKDSDEDRTQETRNNKYDVRENVEEDVTPAPAVLELQKYLESEPPGYSEAFDDESTERPERYAEEEEKPARNSQSAENDEEDEERDEQVEKPSESYVEEGSSPESEEAEEKPDTPEQSESYRDSDDDDDVEEYEGEEEGKENSAREDRSSHVEDGEKEFMRFTSRPFSPFESNEDPKYADLGPRLAKPSFHHPSFSVLSSNYRTGGSGERNHSGESNDDSSEEENREEESRYVFPWEQDEAESGESAESQASARKIERYEYPWERRERLARERRRKRKEREKYEKLFRFSDSSEEDEEQDASHSEIFQRRVYPWEYYEVPTKSFRRTKASLTGKIVDNEEMGSENRPVRKFSSRYKSRKLHPNDDEDPIAASGADPKEIRVSILKSIENASKNEDKSDEPDKISNATGSATQKSSTDLPINHTTPSINLTTSSINPTTPSTNPTTPLTRSRNWKSRSTMSSTSTTIRPTLTTGKPRIWRVAFSTTKKPTRSRTRSTTVASTELPKSGKNDPNASANVSSTTIASAIDRRKVRRRGPPSTRSWSMKTADRKRLQTSTKAPEEVEATTLKTVTERATTPTGKTVEHRSRFSKEEIITKTSYPRMNLEDGDNESDKKNGGVNDEKNSPEGDKSRKVPMNERVEKVSIVTKETPEHIYRKEEIDKDGVKGMFVSITPNNGTNTPLDSKINAEDRKKMLRRFANSEDEDVVQDTGEGIGGSIVQDSFLLTNLLRQVPPYKNDLTLDENVQERIFSEEEGSGFVDAKDDADEAEHAFRSHRTKNPHHRLYYYVEKRKR